MKNAKPLAYCLLAYCLLFFSCRSATSPKSTTPFTNYSAHKSIVADKAIVTCAHPLAAAVGLDIIRQGGNAVDAAIAVQFALAVVYPRAGNIGGGGFMVYRSGDGSDISTLDFREKAPSAAVRDMYLDDKGNVISLKSQKGHLASGVPGTVDGCVKMFQKYSKLKNWKRLVQPAIDLATRGFAITEAEANRLNLNRLDFEKYNSQPVAFVKKDTADKWKSNDILKQPELAATLEAVRDRGEAGFYEGAVADKIVAEMQRGGGLMTLSDLKNYESVWRKPLVGKYRGYDIVTMPPPSSGGIIMLQMLGMIESFPLSKLGFHSIEATHLIIEAERRSYADRAEHMGDGDFYPVPLLGLLEKKYIKSRFADFNPTQATPSADVLAGNPTPNQSEQTTHLSIVDTEGGAVSITTTLNDNYGCRTVVGGAGFILNNEMDDFSAKPGVPNLYGAVGGEANAIQGNKRPLSSMTPTIVLKDGKLFMVVGTPGGTTIPTSVFQTITNVIDFNMTMTEAVHAKRFHSQWLPDIVAIEKEGLSKETLDSLQKMGHHIQIRGYIGLVEAILRRADGKLEGAADDRSDDDAVGF